MKRRDREAIERVEKLRASIERLADAPDAYRPGERIPRPLPLEAKLAIVANAARRFGLTEGDSLVLTELTLRWIDRLRDFKSASDRLGPEIFVNRTVTNPYGVPLADLGVSGEATGQFSRFVTLVFRPESFREFLDRDPEAPRPPIDEEAFGAVARQLGYRGSIPPDGYNWYVVED